MTDLNVGEWVQVETMDGTAARMRADSGALHVAGLSWAYLTPAEWEAAKATGDRLLAAARGRRVIALAAARLALAALAADVAGCFVQFPGLDSMTDEQWTHVARVLRDLPGSLPFLRDLWEQAGQEKGQ